MSTAFSTLLARRGISLDRLNTLVMVADKGSIAAAAGKDNLTRQSQFSRQLKELESCFEQKLTERRGRVLALTAAGLRLAALAREQFLALDRFASESGNTRTAVRIGAGESILCWLLIPALTTMEPKNPMLQWQFFNLQAEDIQNRLMDQRLDFGILRAASSASRLRCVKLGSLDNVLFVPRALLRKGQPVTMDLITRAPLALLEGSSHVRDAIERECRRRKGNAAVHFECTSAVQVAAIVSSGRAAGPLPSLARQLFDGGAVAEVDLASIMGKSKPLHLVWNPRSVAMSQILERIRDGLATGLSGSLSRSGS